MRFYFFIPAVAGIIFNLNYSNGEQGAPVPKYLLEKYGSFGAQSGQGLTGGVKTSGVKTSGVKTFSHPSGGVSHGSSGGLPQTFSVSSNSGGGGIGNIPENLLNQFSFSSHGQQGGVSSPVKFQSSGVKTTGGGPNTYSYGQQGKPSQSFPYSFDEHGNPVKFQTSGIKTSGGTPNANVFSTFDERGNPVKFQTSGGTPNANVFSTFDEHGNPIKFQTSGGTPNANVFSTFDKHGNPVKFQTSGIKTSGGTPNVFSTFDERGNPVKFQTSGGTPNANVFSTFDEHGNPIKFQTSGIKTSGGTPNANVFSTFDEHGNPIKYQTPGGTPKFYSSFDEYGNPIKYQTPSFETSGGMPSPNFYSSFDEHGNPIQIQTPGVKMTGGSSPNSYYYPSVDEHGNPVQFQTTGVKTFGGEPRRDGGYRTTDVKTVSKPPGGQDGSSPAGGGITYKGGCTETPSPPMNSQIRCSQYSGCRATCIPKYQFPNGQKQLFITCKDAAWRVEGTEWDYIPSCEPICEPPCLNNGICIAPDECHCPENFSGTQCEDESIPCLSYPPTPVNSRKTCSSKFCTITCLKGHKFPDGSEVTNTMCKGGTWVPSKPQWVAIPDCKATCTPPCENGGECLALNVCQCPREFRGPQCQYDAKACNPRGMKFNGSFKCTGTGDIFQCKLACPPGIEFEFPPAPVYTCSFDKGKFFPEPIPQCVYGADVEVVPLGGHSYSYMTPGSKKPPGAEDVNVGQQVPKNEFGYDTDADFGVVYPKKPLPDGSYNDSNIGEIPGRKTYVTGTDENVVLESKPRSGNCVTWGGSHYKTFDGQVFSFDSPCAHTLVQDSVDNTFSVVTQNSKQCSIGSGHCHRIVRIYLQDKEYMLQYSAHGKPVFMSGKKVLPIPGRVPGIRAEMAAHYIVIMLDSVGAKVKWDGNQMVLVEVKESLWNRTAGLCGKLDGKSSNDMATKDGSKPKSVATLASSWQVDGIGDVCKEVPVIDHVCPDVNVKGSKAQKAMKFCKKILNDKKFAPCHKVMDVHLLLDACTWDYCACQHTDPTECACETLNTYVKECTFNGVTDLTMWRDEETCPIECTGGRVYMSCGPKTGQPVCGGVSERAEDDDRCEEGCYCPEGMVLHNSECIMKENCPCMYRGKEYAPGASVAKDCNTCTCSDGKWICTQVSCGARCSALGDPHYITFDGKRYDFMGQCTYYLVKHQNFTIEAENVACSGAISQAMNFPTSLKSEMPSCTKTVTVKAGGQTLKLKQNHEVVVNGQEITQIPFSIGGITIRAASSIFLLAELPNKVEVWWDGLSRAYVNVPSTFVGKTKGLCGTFNSNQKDDFLTPEGDVEQSPIPFANKWKTSEKCNDIPDKLKSHPCVINIHKKGVAEEHCKVIKSNLFSDCHWHVDPEPYYQDCLYDMCSCEVKMSNCLCPMIAAYATECADKGVIVDWRNEVKECGIQCPGGQTYQICGNSCSRSCQYLATNSDCRQQCVEGCNCPEGAALDDNGECIPIGQCNCQYDGLVFPADYKEVRPASKAPELCTCVNAQWSCKPATPAEMKEFPKASDLRSKCKSFKNEEFTTCEPAEPVTCKNMHSQELFSASVCRPGCQCKSGHVLDTLSKICIKPTECPCHHGGRSYGEKAVVTNDCNNCTCNHGNWECTDNPCPGECSAWGDSHYKTFDGKMYDYQGQCDYVLAKGSIEKENSFDISIQNVPCGSLGVSCSKSITIRVGIPPDQESITLTRDQQIPEYKTLKRLVVRQIGHYVIVEMPDLGVTVRWDKGTRVYVKLSTIWKNKINGLCGNFNDDAMDDFQTPSGGLTEASAKLFGDSWRLQLYCPEALEITDTCEERPDRKVWSLKRCGILKSSVFSICHAEVPIEPYLEKCIFDTCACDQGGDCECLCTALAAYAHECGNKGIHIKWRTAELCPMQCDERCSQYSPCISSCPVETCDNTLISGQLSKTCNEETCIEGCQVKPCDPGFIYLNSSKLECVPKNVCKPLCLTIGGKSYYEGDLIEKDECHTCYCSRGKKQCRGQPCLTTPQPQTESVKCKSGWTEWINQDRAFNIKTTRKSTDIEPLPGPLMMYSLKGSKCEVKDMIDIECRTVGTHISPKQTGLDVECSTDRGLICRSARGGKPCPDFEIRVECGCGEIVEVPTTPTTLAFKPCDLSDLSQMIQPHPRDCHLFYQCRPNERGTEFVEQACGPGTMYNPKTKVCDFPDSVIQVRPECGIDSGIVEVPALTCPYGQEYSSCAIQCHRLCVFYEHIVKLNGNCQHKGECEDGCMVIGRQKACPPGMFWANSNACVSMHDCMCVSRTGKPVKPGEIIYESACEVCQCIDNYYTCERSGCATTPSTDDNIIIIRKPNVTYEEDYDYSIVPSGVTPPSLCKQENYLKLIESEVLPLDDKAFSASSVLDNQHAPKFSQMKYTKLGDGGSSWIPKVSNKDQYLQIDLGRQEPVYGILIKGNPKGSEFVTSYKVVYAPDGHTYSYVTDRRRQPKTFRGPSDNYVPVKQMFDIPVEAKTIRINPQTWNKGISLNVELIGCGDLATTPTPAPDVTHYCVDPMGVNAGLLRTDQISVSSELKPHHTKKQLKLSSKFSWQPFTNSPSEWIQFDFLEPRNLTGFITRGGPDGWVTAFHVKYSHDGKTWNPFVDDKWNDRLFLGNFDENSPQIVDFGLPVQARFLKIIPINWNQNIQLRIEIHGCFIPYPTEEYAVTEPPPAKCNNCPGISVSDLELDACRCKEEMWWDGKNCVARSQCPCVVEHIMYPVSTLFEKEDCSKCVCKLGGIEHCTPKVCDQCAKGLRSVVTSTCGCICQPCAEGTTLCPTSNICINITDWCNGVKDCPDDETGCKVKPTPASLKELLEPHTTTISDVKESKQCPILTCPPGYKVVMPSVAQIKQPKSSYNTMFSQYSKTNNAKTFAKGGTKGGQKLSKLQQPPTIRKETPEIEECPIFKCVSTKAPPMIGFPTNYEEDCLAAVCPLGYIPEYEVYNKKGGSEVCPGYHCKIQAPTDSTCNVTGRTFNTFDSTEYKYDICNHVLARDLENQDWEISLKKTCAQTCSRNLIINHEEHMFILYSDLSIEFDGFKYNVEQTKKIGNHYNFFTITRLGDTIVFASNKFGFWVIWDNQGNVKIGVSNKLLHKVDGLCGYFNGIFQDDKRKPDGTFAKTTAEFGDSWAEGGQLEICDVKACPLHIQNKAWEMCNQVKNQLFAPCRRVMDLDSFVSSCLETTCSCLEASLLNKEAEEKCRCLALQNFVVECLTVNSDLDLIDWRVKLDCPAYCEAPLVHHDCYRRSCEPNCAFLADSNACPKLKNVCFPGCYCPPGYVRKGENCILPMNCGDCDCNLLPHLEYVTFDKANFTLDGECVYVMSQDMLEQNTREHKYQVLVTNQQCEHKKEKTCVGKVIVIHKRHKIILRRDVIHDKIKMILDSEPLTNFAKISDWAHVLITPSKHVKIFLHTIQIQVSVFYPSLGVAVRAPSLKYGGKLEGLCGDCNANPNNDFRKPDGSVTKDPDEFGVSWLYPDLPGGQKYEVCGNKRKQVCVEFPDGSNPCNQLKDHAKYGQCHPVLDPSMFIHWCERDTCSGHPEYSCEAIEAYSRECANTGFCIDWHTKLCPAAGCPEDQEFKSCTSSCARTCESLKNKESKCAESLVEGCFCPEGKVLLNGTCIEPERCEACDEEGHRPGDHWVKDVCTNCTCEGATIKCQTQSCSVVEAVCEKGYKAVQISDVNQCCDKFMCMPEPTEATTCETPEKLKCSPGQVMKLITMSNRCQQFICECIPIEECEPIKSTVEPLEPGMVREVDKSGCCPVLIEKCKLELCLDAPKCPQYHLMENVTLSGKCCPIYKCVPPNDKCIVDLSYTADEKGGERPRSNDEKQHILKEANEKWQDGPCRECNCAVQPSGGHQGVCSVMECPKVKDYVDTDYELEEEPIIGTCCPFLKKIACKDDDKVYKIGAKWQPKDDWCTTIECAEVPFGLQKVKQVTTCDTACEIGWKYVPAAPELKSCCGFCKAVACVVDGVENKIGEKWTSPDHCTNYLCVELGGSVQIQSKMTTCTEIAEDVANDYVVEINAVPGECCKTQKIVACKVGNKKYAVGEILPSPDGDKCKTVTCIQNALGEILKQDTIESCNTNCSKGWDYKDSEKSCCGECVQVGCVVGDELKKPGENWTSPDGCTNNICETFNNQFMVLTQQEACPNIKDCPPELVYRKGCCDFCNFTSASQHVCMPEEIPLLETIGMVSLVRYPHGKCTNKQPIKGFTECIGTCPSSAKFNPAIGGHEQVCKCCSISQLKSLAVDVQCEDNFTIKKQITVPVSCDCKECSSDAAKKGAVKTVKTG